MFGLRSKSASYERKKQREAERQRQASRSARELGPLPAVSDPDRRGRATASLRVFCEEYLVETFTFAWSPDHLAVIAKLERAINDGGLFALAMPRGSGKTSLTVAAAMWAVFTGRRKYLVVVGATAKLSKDLLASVKMSITTNDLLAADFPEVCHPIRALEGVHQRAPGQLYQGQPTWLVYRHDFIRLPTILGSAASGCVLQSGGITGALRGMQQKSPTGAVVRPDFAIIDDPQTEKSSRSQPDTERRERTIKAAILGMAGPGKSISAVMPCTVIQRGDLADRFLDAKRHPQWDSLRCKLLYEFPANEQLWGQYGELLASGAIAEARALYRRHRAEMDVGARVGWEACKQEADASALEYAMRLALTDPETFWSEYQNEPLAEDAGDSGPTEDSLAAQLSGLARGVVPLWCDIVTIGVDVQKESLWWLACAWDKHRTGVVLDYGVFPKQHAAGYVSKKTVKQTISRAYPQRTDQAAMYAAVQDLLTLLAGRRWGREDGAELDVDRILVDSGWGSLTSTIYQAIREHELRALVRPSKGVGISARQMPMADWKLSAGSKRGESWVLSPVGDRRAVRLLSIDTNYWKTQVMRALTRPLKEPGSLALFGDRRQRHQNLIDHLLAERRTVTTGRGRTVEEWEPRTKHVDNEWLDCAVMAAVAASEQGASQAPPRRRRATAGTSTNAAALPTPKRKRVRYL